MPNIVIICYNSPEIWCVTDRIFCYFGLCFAVLTPSQFNFEKNEKKIWIYYHFKQVHHKWQSYDLRFLRCGGRQTELLSFWTIFCPFTPLHPLPLSTTQKNEKFEKVKKILEMPSFYTSAPKIMTIWYTVPEIQHMTDVIFIFHFRLFFALLLFFFLMKKRKKRLEILSFYTCVPQKLWLHNVQFLRYSAWWMDWQTDRLTDGKSDI